MKNVGSRHQIRQIVRSEVALGWYQCDEDFREQIALAFSNGSGRDIEAAHLTLLKVRWQCPLRVGSSLSARGFHLQLARARRHRMQASAIDCKLVCR
jgi:hypothetical protein